MRYLFAAVLAALLTLPAVALADDEAEAADGHTILGIVTHPYSALTLSRIGGVERWSTGFVTGVEAELGGSAYVDVRLYLHDILTASESEVYDQDQTLQLSAGFYW